MKKQFFALFFCWLIGVFTAGKVFAQEEPVIRKPEPGYTQILYTHDGSVLIGQITAIDEDEIEFSTKIGNLKIKKSNIRSIKDVPESEIRGGEYWFPDPNTTRLYFAPKAKMLKRGEGYFQNIYLFFGGFAYGMTDNITFGGGTSLFPDVNFEDQFFYLTPKVGISSHENLDLALGALVVNLPGDNSELVGILYGVGTIGNAETNLTGGLGYGFVEGDLADEPMLMLGFEKRLSRRMAFVSENWKLPGVDDGAFVSYGIRFFGEKMAVDLAFINFTDEMIYPGVPYVDFVFNF